MASSRDRRPPVVRRPPEMPSLEELDPSATAAFVGGTPKEEPKALKPQLPDASSHQDTDASVPQSMKALDLVALGLSPEVQAPPLEGEPMATEGLDASGGTGAEVPRARSTKTSKHQGTKASKAPTKGRGLVERAGGKAARRVVAYLDPVIAKKLAIRALHEDSDMSALINEAVRRFMAD
jgi:hypothetical protein